MYYGLKVTKQINEHSTSLRKEHAQLRRLLKAHNTPAKQLADSIKNLRLHLRDSRIDSIKVSRTLAWRIAELNLSACGEALVAMGRLCKIGKEVEATLSELDKAEQHVEY